MSGTDDLLHETADIAADYLRRITSRPVGAHVDATVLAKELGGDLPDASTDAATVISELAAAMEPGLVGSVGPRYFGFVIGGGVPAAVAADWLTSVWDQNAGLYVAGPSAAVVEDIAGAWLLELLGLPADASVGFVTGATMANFTGLAAARHTVLENVGWNAERDGLIGAPKVRVAVGAERHATIDVALRYLGFGANTAELIDVDGQGRMRVDALRGALARHGEGP